MNILKAIFLSSLLVVSAIASAQSSESRVTSRINSLINLANGKSFGVDRQTNLWINGQKIQNPDPADIKVGDLCTFKQGARMTADEVTCKR